MVQVNEAIYVRLYQTIHVHSNYILMNRHPHHHVAVIYVIALLLHHYYHCSTSLCTQSDLQIRPTVIKIPVTAVIEYQCGHCPLMLCPLMIHPNFMFQPKFKNIFTLTKLTVDTAIIEYRI